MKKLGSLLLAVCMCLSVGVMLTACDEEHEHTYKTELSKDATHHWHACESEDCTEVSDKAEHTWNDGEITTDPTAEKDGKKTYTCTVCGQTKDEPIGYVPQTTISANDYANLIQQALLNVTMIVWDDMNTSNPEKTVAKVGIYNGKKIVVLDAYANIDGEWVWDCSGSGIWVEHETGSKVYQARYDDGSYENCYISTNTKTPDALVEGAISFFGSVSFDTWIYNEDEKAYVSEDAKLYVIDSSLKIVMGDDTMELMNIGITELNFPDTFNLEYITNPPADTE